MKNSWAGKTLVLSFSFLVKYFSSGGPWEGYTAIFKSKGCLSAGSKRNRSFIGYMWPCQRIFTGQQRLPASFTQFTIKLSTEMAVLLRTQHSQHQPVHNTATKMVHLVSWNADVCTSLWKWSKCICADNRIWGSRETLSVTKNLSGLYAVQNVTF